jgi:excinuclease ABC subunit B
MERAISETLRRRKIQQEYNEAHGIKPTTIKKDVRDIIEITSKQTFDGNNKPMTKNERMVMIDKLTREMKEAAKMLEFEHAAFLRDKIKELED